MFERVDHLGIAVEELDGALASYCESFGFSLRHRELLPEQGVEAAMLEAPAGRIELLAPLRADTPVGRFLARRGPGVHHVAYGVCDLEATLAALSARAVELIDVAPRAGIEGSRVVFVHPRSCGGVLAELVEQARA